jgi:DNA-directed RNA polymerase subunit H (RpoH/RPB5)
MDVIIDKLNKGRKTILEYVKNDYDISNVPLFTEKEIEQIYDDRDGDKDLFDILGSAYSLKLDLKHKKIPSHMIHVIFLNFAPFGKDSTKVSSKTLKEKIITIYDKYFNDFDSLIIIIPESINEGLLKSINDINLHFQYDIRDKELTSEIMGEMRKNNNILQKKHFQNVTLFSLSEVCVNLSKHRLVPKHDAIRDEREISDILTGLNSSRMQLPIIIKTDIQSRIIRLSPGDLCKIKRRDGSIFYRLCR